MFKILKYLGESKASVVAIIALLVLQAYCDLTLPQYTADIVDIGISQGGIEYAVPEEIRAETLENISLFMPEEEAENMKSFYREKEDGEYALNTEDEQLIEELDESMAIPMAMLTALSQSKEMDIDKLKAMIDTGIMTKEQVLEYSNQAMEAYKDMGDSAISQMAVNFVKAEYEAMGVDSASMQTRYLLNKGGRMLGLSIVMMVTAIFSGLIAARVSAKIGMTLRGRVFHKVVSFSNAEMEKFSTASLITRSTNDIQQVQVVSVMLLRMVLYAPIIGIGGIIKVASTRTGMGWIIGVAVGAITVLVAILMKIAMPKFKIMQTLIDRLNLVSREILTGLPVIRAFGREEFEEERFDVANKELMRNQLFTNRVMTFMMPLMMLIMNGITVMIVWFGAQGIDMGKLQVGDLLAFITYTMQIVISFLMITMISVMLPRAGVAAERIEEVIHSKTSIHDKEVVKDEEAGELKGRLSFENVSFKYPGADENALTNISFTAEPGKTTAIIGSTGCGKSTIINLIPRFYDVTEGRITIDGIDIRDLSQHKLRSQLGYVPQKGILFSGDIESNIKFGGDSITDEEMREAAEIAQASEFIDSKADTYKSEISQGGTNVSGGQKQRLSIARAIVQHPKICLFDDSFSALDYKTDVVLRKALHEKLSKSTVIIVAQRISTILHADQIIVLEDGKISGIGTHDELLRSCETYQEIARAQLSEAELRGGIA
ncbi:MAG: ABC transporter ATP-binding protein [Clostridiales bacterium]|nr:ABC transporter ATP-binding protein [Clostridiales bacterium]